jgi:hypothetical protein
LNVWVHWAKRCAWSAGDRLGGRVAAAASVRCIAMHALMRAVLLRHALLDPLGANAEADPPHGELRESA